MNLRAGFFARFSERFEEALLTVFGEEVCFFGSLYS